ncbi:hypothetical protein KW798_03910 [Candidatus Parcubacteria bacterium]|nr:hypothetical protein [Candidatus Parcubacteria bacterium]
MLYKIVAVALVFLGEALAITGELFASKNTASGHYLTTFWQMSLLMAVGGALLVAGYMVGYHYFKNIWIVIVVSLATLAIGEPLLAYVLFGESPTTGALIGLILAILALLSALLIP